MWTYGSPCTALPHPATRETQKPVRVGGPGSGAQEGWGVVPFSQRCTLGYIGPRLRRSHPISDKKPGFVLFSVFSVPPPAPRAVGGVLSRFFLLTLGPLG